MAFGAGGRGAPAPRGRGGADAIVPEAHFCGVSCVLEDRTWEYFRLPLIVLAHGESSGVLLSHERMLSLIRAQVHDRAR